MFLIPYDQFTIATRLTREEATQRLQTLLRPRTSWRESLTGGLDSVFGRRDEPRSPFRFDGTVTADGFLMHRVIGYRNSFLPIVRGHFVARPDGGTGVKVSMRLHWFTLVFMIVWLSFVGRVALTPIRDLLEGRGLNPAAAIPCAMLVFGIALSLVGFWPEATKTRKFLEETLGDRAIVEPR